MMKIFIIGNLGYVGPILVNHLASLKKYQLYGYDIGYFLGNEITKNYKSYDTYLYCQYFGDVRKFDPELLNDIDSVIYLAAISNDPMGKAFELPTYEINQNSAYRIACYAKERGVKRFLFASSCSVYGSADDSPRNENSELNPLTAYAKSKINAENLLKELADDNFQITCFRFATACGFSPRLRLDLVLNDFIVSAYVNKKIEILSNGKPWRPLIHVKDMSRAMEWGLIRKKEEGGNFLVCNTGSNEWNYQVLELAEAVRRFLPDTEISVNLDAPPDKRSYKVDFSLFKKLAGEYYPKVDLEQTIKEFLVNLENFEFNIKDFRNSQFIRLNTLNMLIKNNQLNQNLEII
ncbi:MAG: SDR family oxidoreductase [Bacteroidia bacterium]|nr:SDR family oxidoreductase [Bacteroidia bacterium]